MNVAVVGNVDASKSTLIGTLTKRILDDGNGWARREVLTHPHEKETGRTSAINMVDLLPEDSEKPHAIMLDLAGHEHYISTAFTGLTRYFPKYALLVIAANRGITEITVEHLTTCLNLNIPVIVVISKIDLCTDQQVSEAVEDAKKLCRSKARDEKLIFFDIFETPETSNGEVGKEKKNAKGKGNGKGVDVDRLADNYVVNPRKIQPIFQISNKTGSGIGQLRDFILSLASTLKGMPDSNEGPVKYFQEQGLTKVFTVQVPYDKKGVGLIVYGFNHNQPIAKGDRLFLGPFGKQYYEVRVRSIQDSLRNDLDVLPSATLGCLAIKVLDDKIRFRKRMFVSGKVLLNKPHFIKQFKAEVLVCGKHATVRPGYNPFIHSAHLKVSTRVVETSKIPLIQGDRGTVVIQFFTPQFIFPNTRVILRDGRVKIVGIIREVYETPLIQYLPRSQKQYRRSVRNGEINELPPDVVKKIPSRSNRDPIPDCIRQLKSETSGATGSLTKDKIEVTGDEKKPQYADDPYTKFILQLRGEQ
jgi:GTPase